MSLPHLTLVGFAFAAADLLIEINDQDRVIAALGAGQALVGASEDALVGRDWRDLVDPVDQPLLAAMFVCLDEGQRRGPTPVALTGGRRAHLSARRLPGGAGGIFCALSSAPPAREDPAPYGLHGRESFEGLCRTLSEAARATGVELELAMIELTGLAAAGPPDQVEAQVAGALRAEVGVMGAAARLGDERFAILRERGETADVIARRLTRVLNHSLGDGAVKGRAQAVPIEAAAPSRLARALRFALDDFIAEGLKTSPPDTLAEAMNRSVRRTLARAGELGAVISQRRFSLAFQPVVRLSNDSLHHHEALVRFENQGSPFELVRLAEEFDLIEELDRAIVEQVVRRLKADRTGKLRLAANVSGRSIVSAPFVEGLLRLIGQSPRLGQRLIFEITESAAIDDLAVANRHIQALRQVGCLVCLDDFGAGAASLAYLQALTVDVVKIDGRYVRDLASGGRDAALVRHLAKLCRDLKVQTVAEMVETPEAEAAVREAGVDFAQGWLYGRPADRPEPPASRAPLPVRRTGTTDDWR